MENNKGNIYNTVVEVSQRAFDAWMEDTANNGLFKMYTEASFVFNLINNSELSDSTYDYINKHFNIYLEILNSNKKAR